MNVFSNSNSKLDLDNCFDYDNYHITKIKKDCQIKSAVMNEVNEDMFFVLD